MSNHGKWSYVCPGCQSRQDPDSAETEDVDKIRGGINDRGTAETLAKIHAVKTGHNPEVRG